MSGHKIESPSHARTEIALGQIVRSFLVLGSTSFGGPIASIALMEDHWVRRFGWVSREEFFEIFTLCKMLPGATATQVAISLGKRKQGTLGGILAGLCFIAPAFCLIFVLALFYREGWVQAQSSQQTQGTVAGLQAGALGLLMASSIHFARGVLSRWSDAVPVLSSALFVWFLPTWEPLVIVFWGGLSLLIGRRKVLREVGSIGLGVLTLFWVCLRTGALAFGTGMAMVTLLGVEMVQIHQWLTASQFVDSLVFGQMTPGPLVITASFAGFLAFGIPGLFAATLGVFLPGFVMILLILPAVFRRFPGSTRTLESFARGAIPAVVGGVIASALSLVYKAPWDPVSLGIGATAVICAVWIPRIPSWFMIIASGILGWVVSVRG